MNSDIKINILFADDHWEDNKWDKLLTPKLEPYGIEVFYESQSDKIFKHLESNNDIKLLLLDNQFDNQKLQGKDVLPLVKEKFPYIPVIILTVEHSVPMVTEYIQKLGAYTFFSKYDPPLDCDQLALEIKNAVAHYAELRRSNMISSEINEIRKFDKLVGSSKIMQQLNNTLDSIALANNTSVLITGETGTGKELIARSIHDKSGRKKGPFIAINCGAIPAGLLEAELFGYVQGAFTGALTEKRGKFELAEKGTIFFDEIGELTPDLQVKLLRVLEDKIIEPVGSEIQKRIDTRIVCASNKNLELEVKQGRFREDLYYRINVLAIRTVPLRNKKEDLPELIEHIILKLNNKMGRRVKGVTTEAYDIICQYDWPGNIRELENVIERAYALTMKNREEFLGGEYFEHLIGGKQDILKNDDILMLPTYKGYDFKQIISKVSNGTIKFKDIPDTHKKALLDYFLRINKGYGKQTAEALKISYSSLRKAMEKFNLKSMDYRNC